jgi:predicted MFS family arabinose efflux permease
VLFGSVFGAIMGPFVFSPLLADQALDGDSLATLWWASTGFMAVAFTLVLFVRPDPKVIGERLHGEVGPGGRFPSESAQGASSPAEPEGVGEAAPLAELVRRPGVLPSLVAGQASFAVMVGIMTLTGSVVVDHHHHAGQSVFPIIGAHVIGMYALVLVIGRLIDRIGRPPALVGGLLVMALSSLSLLWVTGVVVTAVALFGLGIGWNLSFVAATATLADCAAPWERGKLLGFNDLLAGLTGATLALVGGLALSAIGVAALAIGGAVLVVVPAAWILRAPLPRLAADEAAL